MTLCHRCLPLAVAALCATPMLAGCADKGDAVPAPKEAKTPPEPWRTDEAAAFAEAASSGRHVFIDFRATWCEPCKKMEAILEKDEVYAELTKSFVPLEFDITDLTPQDNEIKARYKSFHLPTVIFVQADKKELGRFEGETPTQEAFVAKMRGIIGEHPPRP